MSSSGRYLQGEPAQALLVYSGVLKIRPRTQPRSGKGQPPCQRREKDLAGARQVNSQPSTPRLGFCPFS